MAEDPPAERREQGSKGSRARTVRFIAVFVVSVLLALTGYRFAIDTLANDWYLFHVAEDTTGVLQLIGHRAELEGGMMVTDDPATVRARMLAWSEDREATPDDIAAADSTPLTAWESWRYRATAARESGRQQTLGPRVAFVLKAGTSTWLNEIEQELRDLRRQRVSDQQGVAAEIKKLEGRRDELRNTLQRARTEEGGEDPNPSYVFHFIVVPECGAIEVMAIFFSAVVAFPTRWWKRALGLVAGIPLMYLVNIFRLSCLAVIGALDGGGQWFNFAHHYVWQAVYIVFVVAVWLAWVEYVVRRRVRA
jgi:exosortase/archaeosortase family protein